MNKELNAAIIEFVGETVSSISPYKTSRLKALIEEASLKDNSFFLSDLTSQLSQGDVVSNIEYPTINEQTKEISLCISDVMILSNSCNIVHKDKILVVPIVKDTTKKTPLELNKTYEIMCIDEKPLKDKIILLDSALTLPTKVVIDRIESNKSSRVCSLSIFGINLLYLKLSILLMRPESEDVSDERQFLETSTS